MEYLSVTSDGYLIIRRCNYLYREGSYHEDDYRRIGDGDICCKLTDPNTGYKDLADAKEIIDWINRKLSETERKEQ